MIRVIGASPEKIELPELNDRIYYKQEKSYSELDYQRCPTLRRAIDKGYVLILERSQENKEYGAPPVSHVKPQVPNSPPTQETEYPKPILGSESKENTLSAEKIDLLLNKISALEEKIEVESGRIIVDSTPLNIILNRLKELEDKVSTGTPTASDNTQVMAALKALEDKVNSGTSTEDLIKRLESALGKTKLQTKNQEDSLPKYNQETYVPNVTVEDANSHINLKVRTVERSDGVNNALDALKKIKKKSNGD